MLEEEKPNHEQIGQADVPLHSRSFDQVFLELEQRQTLSYEGIPGIQTIVDQFHGTPIAEVFADFPEGATIHAAQLRNLVDKQLHYARRHVKVGADVAYRRYLAMEIYPADLRHPLIYDDFDEDENITERALQFAQPIRDTIFHLVPTARSNPNGLFVEFTPVMKTDQQLILCERRYREMFVNPAESRHVYTVEEEQYTLFTYNEQGNWQEQGVLPFRTISEYEDKPTAIVDAWRKDVEGRRQELIDARKSIVQEMGTTHDKMDAADEHEGGYHSRYYELGRQIEDIEIEIQLFELIPLQRVTAIPEMPFESTLFNEGVNKPEEVHVFEALQHREIFAALPQEFDFSAIKK